MIASAEFTTLNRGAPREVLYRNAGYGTHAPQPRDFGIADTAALAVRLVHELDFATRHASLPPLPLDDCDLYRLWLSEQPCPSRTQRERMAQAQHLPLVSFVLHIDHADCDQCAAAIASVCAQIYPRLELLLIGRRASAAAVSAADLRVRSLRASPRDRHAALFNRALGEAAGSHIAAVGPHDVLAETASYEIAAAAAEAEIMIADEDELDMAGARRDPCLGAAWDPDAILAGPLGGLVAISVDLLRRIGGMRTGLAAAGAWDLLLRASVDVPVERIRRLSGIQISRRRRSLPAVSRRTTIRVVTDHLRATGRLNCTIVARRRGPVRVVYPLPADPPLVSLIVATRDGAKLLRTCLQGVLHRTRYPRIEVVVMDNGSTERDALAELSRWSADPRVRIRREDAPFNWSALNNRGVREARGAVMVLLNNDVNVMHADWLSELVAQALRPDVGIVGAKLLYSDRTIQHAGIVFGPDGHARHMWRHAAGDVPGYMRQLGSTRQVSALTGACIALRREVFYQAGGLAEDLPITGSDTDLCLAVRTLGLRVIWTPHARLIHPERSTRAPDPTPDEQGGITHEQAWMEQRWGESLRHDPYLSPQLLPSERVALLNPQPRTSPSWSGVG